VRYLDEPPASAELVIIGGGVVGAATAFHAARVADARDLSCAYHR